MRVNSNASRWRPLSAEQAFRQVGQQVPARAPGAAPARERPQSGSTSATGSASAWRPLSPGEIARLTGRPAVEAAAAPLAQFRQEMPSATTGATASAWRPISAEQVAAPISAPSARGPVALPVQGPPTMFLPGETREQFDRAYNEWRQANPAPPRTGEDIAVEVLGSVVGGGPLPGFNVSPRPGIALPIRPAPGRTPSRPPSPQPPRPHSAPPATSLPPRPGEGPTRPSSAEPALRPESPGPSAKRPLSPDFTEEAGPSKRPALDPAESPASSSVPAAPQPDIEVKPVVASPEMQAVLNPGQWSSPADAFTSEEPGDPGVERYRAAYRQAFQGLTPAEQYALRNWTHVEGAAGQYMDEVGGQRVPDDRFYPGLNYELNAYLRGAGGTPDPTMEAAASRLHNALSKLPKVPMDSVPLLRVADVPADYASRIGPGDLVTNGRPFMSASSNRGYAAESLEQGYAAEGRTGGMAIYEFQARSAVPTLPGVTTPAGHEAEWLFMPNRVFKANEVTATRINTRFELDLPLTGVRLEEVPVTGPTAVFNLHTGAPAWVFPADRDPPPLPSERVPSPGPGGSDSSGYYYTSGSSD